MQRSVDGSDIVAEARRWIGTPFRHQMAHRGVGADCVGFVRGVAEALNLIELSDEVRRQISNYGRTPNPERFGEMLAAFLDRASIDPNSEAPDGYIAWLQWTEGLPMHLSITATFRERPTLIHALRRYGVAEHGFAPSWRRRVHSYWRIPGVTYG